MNIIRIRNNNLNDNTLLYRGTNPRQEESKQKSRNPRIEEIGRGGRGRLLGSVIADGGRTIVSEQ